MVVNEIEGDSIDTDMPIAFMYSGQGSQYYHMAKELYQSNLFFKSKMEELDDLVSAKAGVSVLSRIYHPRMSKMDPFDETLVTHQAIFIVEYALTALLQSYGIKPSILVGASLGEITAATISGILSVEDCVDLLIDNALVLNEYAVSGGMTAVLASPECYHAMSLVSHNCEIASINFDEHFVVSGQLAGLETFESHLSANGVMYQRLAVRHGFHSSELEPVRLRLLQRLNDISYGTASLPVYSSMTGGKVTSGSGEYIWNIFRQPVDFFSTIRQLETGSRYFYLDLGPSGTLSTFVKYILSSHSCSRTCPVIMPYGHDIKTLKRVYELINLEKIS